MKNINLGRYIFYCVFLCSLFVGQQALAEQADFVLMGFDNKEVGQGNYEELPDSIAKISISMENHQYVGTGIVVKVLAKTAKGLRADRAMMNAKYKKHVVAELLTTEDIKLDCEINLQYGSIWGPCVNPENQEAFTIRSSKEITK